MSAADATDWSSQVVLVTGATGSFGRRFVEMTLAEKRPAKLIVFSRDELKQHEMQASGLASPALRYFLGDVRDLERLRRAMRGVDIVVHAAALKQVPACEYNPFEAVQTNVNGAKNVIDAALDCGVKKVVALSTDKAVAPANLYGATKLVAEKLFVQANAYAGADGTRFGCVRYGNVIGSRGSVLPLFRQQRTSGELTVTDRRMTRFWITLEQGVRFVMHSIDRLEGGEVFVPKIPASTVVSLAQAIAPGCAIREIGIRPGEKLHEVLISQEEARHTVEIDAGFAVLPATPFREASRWDTAPRVAGDFCYSSDDPARHIGPAELAALVDS